MKPKPVEEMTVSDLENYIGRLENKCHHAYLDYGCRYRLRLPSVGAWRKFEATQQKFDAAVAELARRAREADEPCPCCGAKAEYMRDLRREK